MRRVVPDFDLFVCPDLPHEHARELRSIDKILCENPTFAHLVWEDLQSPRKHRLRGRPGLSAEQVLRMVILKQMKGFGYEELAFHVADSRTYLNFCRFTHPLEVPKKSAIHDAIRRISGDTWHQINDALLQYAQRKGVEDGQKVRIDPTVVEANIHHPLDNSLLFDSVRVLCQILQRARKGFGVHFRNQLRSAKRCHMAALNAKRQEQRLIPYKKLLAITRRCVRSAEAAIPSLRQEQGPFTQLARSLAEELDHYLPHVRRVISQTERRVLRGESVPAEEKLVSIFETHTDIIRKDNRDTYYGHKLTLTGGASALVLDWVLEEGNPADSTLFLRMLDRQKDRYGQYPRQTTADGGMASKNNLKEAKERGVQDVVFAKKASLRVPDMASSTWVYRQLRNFRAGIEGVISFLKRVFGLDRCTWKGATSFASYVGASVVSANLLLLARHLLS